MKLLKGSEGTMFNLSPSTTEVCNTMGTREEIPKWHINFDGQGNEQQKHWLLYESGMCN